MLRRSPVRSSRSVRIGVGVAVVAVLLHVVQAHVWPLERWYMYDLDIYRQGGRAVLDGGSLYADRFNGQPFTNTPFSALLFAGLALLSMEAARVVMTVLTVASLGVAVWRAGLLSGLLSGRRTTGSALAAFPAVAVCAVFAVGLWSEPVQSSLAYGQVNVVLMALVLLDFSLPDRHRGKGVAIGLAAAVKLTPGLFAVYLLLTGRVRAAAVAGGTMLATVGLGFALAPVESADYWGGVFLQSSRIGGDVYYFGNQSLRGLLGRLTSPEEWVFTVCLPVVVVVVAFLGMRAAVRLHRVGDELGAVLTCALTALLVSPLSWHHHWVWCVPLLVHSRRWAVAVLFTAWPLPNDAFPLPQGLLPSFENLYVLAGLAGLGLVVAKTTRNRRGPDPRPTRASQPPTSLLFTGEPAQQPPGSVRRR
ncbi:glycosyltransferase 87 family protein [Saccharothrix sp. NRRL B-16314]|uniref:glycosyltransferase 87 family protein n=1 Tax=Saccharothrix sp. NRRL B-16314 TaxID=1463825 RepID=UPI0012DD3688|nr:glycosyltransferase 87 family protein [Saccharothrix sp. NRRL B-16314]